MRSPVSVANKELIGLLNPLDATLMKNRGWGPLPCDDSTFYPSSSFSSPHLSFHALTNCPFRKPFVLTFMHRMGGVGGGGELSSQKFSTNALSALDRELSHRCGAIRPLQNAAERACFATDITHAEDSRRNRVPGFRRPRHESDFFAFHHQRRARFR